MRVTTAASALVTALLLSFGAASALVAQGGERPKPNQRPEVESGNRQKQKQKSKSQDQNQLNQQTQSGPSVNDSTGGTLVIDQELASEGAKVWANKGCDVCHGIGQGKITGPDLENVQLRHNVNWLRNWIRDPAEVARTDPYAQGLVSGYNHIIMPNLELTDHQIDAVINYIARESQQKSQ